MVSLGRLASGVAHEINNPIGFISSNLNTLGGYVKDIDELVLPINIWSTTEEINFAFSSRDKTLELIESVREKYSDANINDIDGILVEYSDWGFLLRASNTEAKLRLIVDAKTEKLMEEKKNELVGMLRR